MVSRREISRVRMRCATLRCAAMRCDAMRCDVSFLSYYMSFYNIVRIENQNGDHKAIMVESFTYENNSQESHVMMKPGVVFTTKW